MNGQKEGRVLGRDEPGIFTIDLETTGHIKGYGKGLHKLGGPLSLEDWLEIPHRDADPTAWGTDERGRTWFDATLNLFKFWDGTQILGLATGPSGAFTEHYIPFGGASGALTQSSKIAWNGTALHVDGAAVFNEAGADRDFRVESGSNTHCLFVDASTSRVGVNNNNPSQALDVTGFIYCSGFLEVGTQIRALGSWIWCDSSQSARLVADSHNDDASFDLYEDAVTKWTMGFDYSDSFKFKISQGAVGVNTRLEIISGGSMNVYDTASGHIQITAQASGTARLIADSYTDDSYVELQQGNALKWCAGYDYTDGSYRIGQGAPGTNDRVVIANGGAFTLTSIAAGVADYDKYLVSDSGVVKYRTGANVLADLSGDAGAAFDWNSQNLTSVGTIECGTITSSGNVIIANAGYIGSVSDTDAMQIEAAGDIVISQGLTVADFLVVDTTTFVVNASGYADKVGIGTPTPGRQFEILHATSAVLSLQSTSVAGTCSIYFGDVSDDNIGRLVYRHATDDFVFRLGSTNKVMFEMVNGNIGIGQSTFGTNMAKGYAQSTGVAPGSSPPDCFQMYSADIGGVATKAGVHFRDEEGNVVSIGTGGILATGNARVMVTADIDIGKVKLPGVNQPGEGTEDNFGTLDFDKASDEEVYLHWHIPHKYADAGTIAVHFYFFADAQPGSDEVARWGVEYKKISVGDVFDFSAGTSTATTGTTIANADPLKTIYRTGDMSLTTTGFVGGDHILFRLYRDADGTSGTDDLDQDARMFRIHVEYLADKQGKAL